MRELRTITEIFNDIDDPRQQGKVSHDLVELLSVAVAAVLCGADNCVEISIWARSKIDWLRCFLTLENGIASHDTYSAVFAAIDAEQFSQAFISWAAQLIPAFAKNEVIAIDGKTSRRTKTTGQNPLHLVSAFAAQAGLVLGQQACAEKSNEKTAIPELLDKLFIKDCIVTIDAMGTQANIAKKIVEKEADYVLAVKANQKKLAESIQDFYEGFLLNPENIPHSFHEQTEKDHGRIEVRRCYSFGQIELLDKPQRRANLNSFAIVETQRHREDEVMTQTRLYISSLAQDAEKTLNAVRRHWTIENNLHWCMDVAFNDDQMRLREKNAAHNLATIKQSALNLIKNDPERPKASIKSCRLLAAGDGDYLARLLGWL